MTSARDSLYVSSLLDEIGQFGQNPSGGYSRFAWSSEDQQLREWFVSHAEDLGLDVTEDRVGNQWAWWGDPDAAANAGQPGIVTGSHLDSVPDGGNFDGPLGVASSLAAVASLKSQGYEPARPIGIANFVDEEGARFGVACAGSRLLTGAMSETHALGLRDRDGVTVADALKNVGRDPRWVGRDQEALRRIGTFVELHIEQGKFLAGTDFPVAVGSSVWPHGRWRFDFEGVANHAGTTRLEDRDDPMLKLAELILQARQVAERLGCVATVGKVQVTPNGVNAIPSLVSGWLDARGADEAMVKLIAPQVEAEVGARAVNESFTPTTEFDPTLAAEIATLLGDVPVIATGAGHDAGILAGHGVSSAMLFVRNPTGVSHSPSEHAEATDCNAGVSALETTLVALAQR